MSLPGVVGFPTQGEVLRFLYNATGVLPSKRDSSNLDDTKRKALQKALQRLASEEGELEARFEELVDQLVALVAAYGAMPHLAMAFQAAVVETLDLYRQVLRDEGTYLTKRDNVRWLLVDRWVPAAAGVIARAITRLGLRALAPYFPDDQGWYLPRDASTKQRWPLQAVMKWVYERADRSQTQFHYPGREVAEPDAARQRDLENAQNWQQGRSLPSAEALRWTFDRALRTDAACRIPGFDKPLQSECAQAALFLCCLATSVWQSISAEFGDDFLTELCEGFQHQLAMALAEMEPLEDEIIGLAKRYSVLPLHPDLRSDVIAYWAAISSTRLPAPACCEICCSEKASMSVGVTSAR